MPPWTLLTWDVRGVMLHLIYSAVTSMSFAFSQQLLRLPYESAAFRNEHPSYFHGSTNCHSCQCVLLELSHKIWAVTSCSADRRYRALGKSVAAFRVMTNIAQMRDSIAGVLLLYLDISCRAHLGIWTEKIVNTFFSMPAKGWVYFPILSNPTLSAE